MSYNTGLLFYRHYYKDIDFTNMDVEGNKAKFKKWNEQLYKSALPTPPIASISIGESITTFDLTTTYPGLTLGTGYAHGSGLLGEAKIGFFFDHTTGLPVIPGSSVKGILRSVFPASYRFTAQKSLAKGKEKEAAKLSKKADAVEKFLLRELKKLTSEEKDAAFLAQLENEIFGKIDSTDNGLKMSERDVFFDAFPIKSEGNLGDAFLGEDFITPHKTPFTNPIPIQFLKVLPGVTFRFQFDLKESVINKDREIQARILTVDERKKLFQTILETVGVGAKTNVGYGHFQSSEIDSDAPEEASSIAIKKNLSDPIKLESVKKNKTIEASVLANQNGQLQLRLNVLNYEKTTVIKYASADRFSIGDALIVNVIDIQGKGANSTIIVRDPKPI